MGGDPVPRCARPSRGTGPKFLWNPNTRTLEPHHNPAARPAPPTVPAQRRAAPDPPHTRIRLKLDSVAAGMDALGALVADAYQRRADLALGYETWADYADAEFAEQTRNLAAPIRRELVGRLAVAGMSTRAIAPAVGVSNKTVSIDRREVLPQVTPDPLAEEKADGRVVKLTGPGSLLHSEPVEHIDMATGEVLTDRVAGVQSLNTSAPDPTAGHAERADPPQESTRSSVVGQSTA